MFGSLLSFAGVRFFRLAVFGFFFVDGPLAAAVAVAATFIDDVGCACDSVGGASGGIAGVAGDVGDEGVALEFAGGVPFLVNGVAPVADGSADAYSAVLCLRVRSCLALLDLSMHDAPQIWQT